MRRAGAINSLLLLVFTVFITTAIAQQTGDFAKQQEKDFNENSFFPSDPYPGLGSLDINNLPWHFLRLAGYAPACNNLGLSQETQHAINVLYQEYVAKARKQQEEIQRNPQYLKPYKTWEARREALGWEGYQKVEKMLSKNQLQQINQVIALRQGPRIFDLQHIQRSLRLSDKQMEDIAIRRQEHAKRVERNQQGGARLGDLKSYRRLGIEIQQILNAKQRSCFNEMRGIAEPGNREEIQQFTQAIKSRMPEGWKVDFNDHVVKLSREKKIWALPLFGMPGQSTDQTDEEYLKENGYETTLDIHLRFVPLLMDDEIQKLARKLAAGPPQPSKPLVGKEVLDHGFQHAERNELPKYYTATHSIFEMTLPGSPEYTVKDAPAMAEWNKLREQIALVLQPYQE